MAGTKAGGAKAAATIKANHGEHYYALIGSIGGRKTGPKGFASSSVGKDGLTGFERASVAGRKGGRISRKPKVVK